MGKWTRRGFITAGVLTGGVLAVGVAIRPGHRAPRLAAMMEGDGETLVNVWVKIGADNSVTAIVPHSEMGQGVFTSMAQMLADELDADWESVRFEQAPAHEEYANFMLGREYLMGGTRVPGIVQDTLNGAFLSLSKSMGLQITGGSTAVRFTGQGGMRIAGAAARDMIIRAAAAEWGVPRSELTTELSHVIHAVSDRRAPYADFAERAGTYSPPTQPRLKTPDEWTLMGTSVARFDIPSKVDGTAEFGIDVDLPNLVYASVKGPPVLGAELVAVEASTARAVPGVIDIVEEPDFVAVVATGWWQANQAIQQLDITWSETPADTLSQNDLFTQFRTDMDTAVAEGSEKTDVKIGNARRAAEAADRVHAAEYTVPYLAHAAMEPLNATAWIHDGRLELWSGLQNPLAVRNELADQLGFDRHDVEIHNTLLGGGFGRRSNPDYPMMAARIAQKVDAPVKMIWSREEDTQQDWYRPAVVARVKAGLDSDDMPVSWDYQFVHKHDPPEASEIPYNIEHQLIHYTDSPNHMRFGPWRSVDHTQHGYFIECFIDELAHEAGQDGYAFRRQLLADKPRFLAVLDKVAEASGWGRELPAGHGLGIAVADSFGTLVAQVAEVDVTGREPRVRAVWAAADPGHVINPDGFIAQIESGIIYGLTAVLYGEITVADGAVVQSNFHDYPMLRMDAAPRIHVDLINSGANLGGGGEPGTPPIAPAVANAVFNATGRRVRSLPLAGQDISYT